MSICYVLDIVLGLTYIKETDKQMHNYNSVC